MIPEFLKHQTLTSFQATLQKENSLLIEELNDSAKGLLIALALKQKRQILCLSGRSKEESHLFHNLPFFTDEEVIEFPSWETLPSEEIPPSPDIIGERYRILWQFAKENKPLVVLCNLQAALQKVLPKKTLESYTLNITVGEEISFDDLKDHLSIVGYQERPLAVDKGEFAIRNGILDIFPVSSTDPIRLTLLEDKIKSIRRYNPISQISQISLKSVFIPPALEKELLKEESELSSLIEYFDTPLIIFDDLLALEERFISLEKFHSFSFMNITEFLKETAKFSTIYLTKKKISNFTKNPLKLKAFNTSLTTHLWKHQFIPFSSLIEKNSEKTFLLEGDAFLRSVFNLTTEGKTIHFVTSHQQEREYIEKKLKDLELTLPLESTFIEGYLSSSLVLKELPEIIVPYTEITHRYKIRRQKQRSNYHTTQLDFTELSFGDTVVHLDHGMGRFLRIEKRPNHIGELTEFLLLEYANSAQLYVPFTQSHLVSKYIGANEGSPSLHTLGSNRWKRAKENTEKSLVAYASQILETHAQRELQGGFSCPDSGSEFKAFEEEFPFVETEDQSAAIEEVKKDMIATTPMDRLICGDVGYGKTEVAMRAACKAVLDGNKQVAILVPTTVLALQHYETFCERMKEYSIVIKPLSRFQKPKEIKETLKELAKGNVDIIIGTHRITSKDVVFKNLGLLIIDEEQRFGVKVKEHIKGLKAGIDSLSMSATPIPRTLYLSLTGARDMSTINTPPQDRLPIKTIITESNNHVIQHAIQRELARDGQIYIIHNRVESIYRFAERIQKLEPKAKIVVGHGQMPPEELDHIFHLFKKGEVDILVSTTIVENGIDVPNANTILIDQADHFGLADLYQLRGRVGRWNRRAFAYFLIPSNRVMAEISEKRLRALEEANGFGGGMRIAMRDLELRGAGNILGTEQSGHITAIGFHLYCKLLKQTISQLQGNQKRLFTETKLEFPQDARIPEEYINETTLRMNMYQRFGEMSNEEQLEELIEELKDRFGELPKPTIWLYHLMRIRIHAASKRITHLKIKGSLLYARQQKGKEFHENKFQIPLVDNPEKFESFVKSGLDHHFKTQ